MIATRLIYLLTGCLTILPYSIFCQKTPDVNILKGIAYSARQQNDSVIYYLEMAGDRKDAYPEAYIYYGNALMAKGQNLLAISKFMKAEKMEQGIASYWIAKSYARMGELDNALEYLKINIKSKYSEQESKILLDPDFQKFEKNIEWEEFWRNTPDHTTLENVLFEADYNLKSANYTEALEIINEGLKKGLRKNLLYSKRAEIYLAMNNNKMAVSDLDKAIEGDTRNPVLYARRASLSNNLGRYRQALEDYNIAIKYAPLNLELYKGRANAGNGSGLYESAIADIDYYLSFFPEDHDAWYQSGLIHMSNKKYLNALGSFNKALELNRNNSNYFSARGETYMQTKTYRYAWNDFSMALDINPVNPKIYLLKGIAAMNLGNLNDACYSFDMARKQGSFEVIEYINSYCEKNGRTKIEN